MTNDRLTVEVEPELGRRITAAAASKDETVKDFIERAVLRELRHGNGATKSDGEEPHPPESERATVRGEDEWDDGEELYVPPKYVKPRGSENPIKPKGGGNPVSDAVIEDREFYPSEGGKPQGSKNPPTPRSGRTVADAVIEDRR